MGITHQEVFFRLAADGFYLEWKRSDPGLYAGYTSNLLLPFENLYRALSATRINLLLSSSPK